MNKYKRNVLNGLKQHAYWPESEVYGKKTFGIGYWRGYVKKRAQMFLSTVEKIQNRLQLFFHLQEDKWHVLSHWHRNIRCGGFW